MATSGLNYLISVQLDQLQGLQKLHDTIVGIQQLSQKGAEFNVRVNASSLSALTKEISDSVSKGFSRASASVSGSSGGPSVSVDTTKLESSISRLAEVVGRMGTGGGGGVAAPPSGTRISAASRNVLRDLDEVIKMYDDVLAQRAQMTKEMAEKLRRYVTKVSDPSAGEAGIRQDLLDFRERVASRAGRYGGSGTPGVAVDASVLKQAFESGSQQLAGAMRKGIEDATDGLSRAITQAVINGLSGGGQPNYRPVSGAEADKIVQNMSRYMSPQQLEMAKQELYGNPAGQTAGALRLGSRYLSGISTRDQGLFADAAAGGVMALPQQYKELLTKRVTASGEVLRIEEKIAALMVRREQARDARDKATDPAQRARFDKAFGGIQSQIDESTLEKDRAIFAQLNKQIESAVAQYRAVLTAQRGSNQITPDEYTRKIGSLNYATERMKSLQANNPNIDREMLLLPDALAQYVRDTLNKYVVQLKRLRDTGQAIDQPLLDELSSSAFLSNIAGRRPTDARQAGGAIGRVQGFLGQFGAAKTAYEFIKSRAQIGLPAFNPNLDIDTAPYLPGEEDPGRRPREERERYMRAFLARGGAFAAQTAERRAFATQELEKMYQQEREGTLGEAGQRRLLEYQREMEFGGRFYYSQSPFGKGGLIDNGVLMSSAEAARVRKGGVRSEVVGGSLGAAKEALSADAKAANDLYQAMGYVEGALGRVTRAIADLGKVKFDPIIAEFQKLSAVLQPYAASLERASKALDMQYAAKRITNAKAKQEAIEQAKTAGMADRLALAQSLGISVAGPAFAAPRPGSQSASGIPLISQDPETLRAMLLRGAKQIAGLQAKSQDLLSLEAAQLAAGLPSASTARRIGQTGAQYNATLGTFAANAAALAERDPRFFGRSSQDVLAASQGLLGAQSRSVQLGDEIRILKTSMEQFKEIQGELKRLEGNKSDSANLRRQSLTSLREKLLETRDASLDRLLKGGVLQPGESSSNTAKVLDTLKTKQRELNAEVAKYSDLLLKSTESSVKAEMAGGGFLDRIVNKFQNLSAYLFAGGALFTIASQLRQASQAAIGFEADLARIQGVLSSKSAGQAGIIGSGIMGAASEYGVGVGQSLQAGKIFSQTGASPARTVELTRAALAAQVGAGLEAGQATELLIAVENITNRQVKSFDILDRISRIESQYAVSAQDLSNAIQRAGSLAMQLQPQALGAVDALDLIIGSATTIIERTRITGEQAATSLRFIISRLAAPEVSRSLQERFNIRLAGDDPKTLRPLQDILKDVADRYQQLRSSGQTVQAQQLLTTFAGARQSNVAAALLEGFNDALRVASESSLAYGDTQERVKIQLETMESKFAQFNTALAGFANTLINETGLGWLAKRGLELGTGILSNSQSGLGAIGTAAAVGAGGYAASRGATAMLGLATRPGVAALTTSAAGMGATALGGLATGGVYIAGTLAVMGALELLASGIERIAKRNDINTAERFDRQQFRESDFYKSFEERAMQFGVTPDNMASTFRGALNSADSTVQAQLRAGTIRQDQVYNRTLAELVKNLETAIPAFSSIGDQAAKTAKALELLRESARYSFAVPQTYTNELIKDLEDMMSLYDRTSESLAKRLRDRLKVVGIDDQNDRAVALDKFSKDFRDNTGRQWLNLGSLTAFGANKTFRNLLRESTDAPVATLDNYARDFLYVGDSQRARLESYEAQLRQQGKTVTFDSVMGAIRADKGINAAGQEDLGTSYYRLQNQRQLAAQIARSMNERLGNANGERTAQMEGDLSGSGEAGEMFATTLRQAIETARVKVIADARAMNKSAAELRDLNEQLDRLSASAGRAAKMANLATTSVTVRDRFFEPIVAYGSQMAEISTRERISQRFGTSYDAVGARSQAAQSLLVGLDQVPVRMLQDRIREAARIVSGVTGTFSGEIRLADDGGAIDPQVRVADAAAIDGLMLARRDDIDKVNKLKDQYVMATTRGLGAFIDQGLNSSNASVQSVAANLKDALDQLSNFGKIKNAEDLKRLAALEGNLTTQREKAIAIVGGLIEEEQKRFVAARTLSRTGQDDLQMAQLAGGREQARLQARLGALQADPRSAGFALTAQMDLLTLQRDLRIQTAQIARDNAIAGYMQQPDSKTREQDILDAQATFDRERNAAEAERATTSFAQLSQTVTQLNRRRQEESLQLVQDLTSPLSELLSNSKNFSREGYQRAFEGIGQAAQRRLVDIFMRNMFSETGMLGATLRDAFNAGALSTETALERAFREGAADLYATITAALNQSGVTGTGASANPISAAARASGYTSAYEYWQANLSNDVRWEDLSDDQIGQIEAMIGPAAAAGSAAVALSGARSTPGLPPGMTLPPGVTYADVANANVVGKGKLDWKAGLNSALPVAGSLIGANLRGDPAKNFASEGASVGALIGNMILPGLGGLAGGLLGGLFGGAFGKKQPETELQVSALERIERNTRQQIEAIENQTKMLTLDSRFMNVPTGFTVPGFRPFGVGGGDVNLTVNISGTKGDAQETADLVSSAIRRELRGLGTSYNVLNN